MKKNFWLLLSAAMVVITTSCSKDDTEWSGKHEKGSIEAIIEELDSNVATVGVEDETRFGVSEETLAGGSWAYFWEPNDAMGVYTDGGEYNVKYVNTKTENATGATFAPESATVTGTPTYAYYPYNANAGDDLTAVKSSIPSANTINEALTTIPGMHRRGVYKSTTDGVSTFGFRQPFAMIRFALDAAGTKLEGQRVKSIKVAVKRAYIVSVPICGDVTINLEDASYTSSNTSNIMTFEFEGYPTLESSLTFVSAMLPKVKKYDRFYFTVEATGYTATFNVASTVAWAANSGYTYSLPMKNYSNLKVTTNDIEYVEPEEPTDPEEPEVPTDPVDPEEPETPTEPETITGTFTAATYNVDGLPQKISIFTINGDGPGSDGTTSISSKIAEQNWDFVGFSEDFNYNSELTSSLSSAFKFGTHRGTVSASNLSSRADTDGLQFATRNATCSYLSESWTQFVNEYGGLTSGANTCIAKGIRHYPVQLADGVVVDVIITHMNTYSDSSSSFINAQHGQLTEVAEYINATMAANNRPIIFMGDTNCRYTRHDFATYFWGKLSSDLTYADPWVEFQWAGVYPTYPSNSLMVSDATGTSSSDIICSTTQNGEVVDKVIYINKASNAVQIKANSYLRDYDNFNGLADHMPIVVNFTWTKTVTE